MNKVIKPCLVAERQIDQFGAHIMKYNIREVWFLDNKPIALGNNDLRETSEPLQVIKFDGDSPDVDGVKKLFIDDLHKKIQHLSSLEVHDMPVLINPDDFLE